MQEFLFVKDADSKYNTTGSSPHLQEIQDKIQALNKSYDGLRSQVDFLAQQVQRLQQKVIHLETLRKNFKYPLSDALAPSNTSKTI